MSLPPPGPDRCAVVTGASSGIGSELARELGARGHQVVLVARSEDKLATLAAELGERAHVLPADLADREARAGLLERVTALGLVPDVLVNNAGLSTLGPVHRSDPAAEINLLEVDVVAVADLCSRFLPGMVERGRGAVLNVASTAAFQPLPGQAAYGGAKAFVLSYSHSLSGELAGTGVSVTVLCPGPVETGFNAVAGFDDEEAHDALPSIMWVSAAEVARAAVAGMDRGRVVVIPGVANRAGAALARFAPKRLLVPLLARNHPGLR
ncbi:SDR family NAD(P)-dependent oxidoreductase [Nocardioides pocheonensis]|uniref:SDR family oxidoreductase n=1 Tax=Nocardioides pocheonensis TaxID=661485 RepID=A0A3N0GMB0_9ACTN|nr:SDR family oxidoreductase [Nocardioides pocheonensis]RNM13541.1 SDR family oxidoreductase [Nocardioides pocheonensis]